MAERAAPGHTGARGPLSPSIPPSVLVISPEHWPRVFVRALLRERGYDALGAETFVDALREEPVDVLVIDEAALAGGASIERLIAGLGRPRVVLLAHGLGASAGAGPWARVLRRPIRIADVAAAVEGLWPLTEDARHPLDA